MKMAKEESGVGIPTEARQKAREVSGHAREIAEEQVEARQARAGSWLATVAGGVRAGAEHLRQQEHGMSEVFDRVADGIEHAARDLRERSPRDVLASLDRFGRREPTGLFLAAASLGFVGSRFAKSSSEAAPRTEEPRTART
jgi:hypothetical protein